MAPISAAEPALPEGSGVDRAGLILFTLAAMQFISTVDFMIVMPLGPLLFDTLGFDTVQFSWGVSAYTFAAGCAGFAAAAVLDRVGRRSAYIALSAGLLLRTLACGLATNYQLLVAARCLTGAFGGVLGGLSHARLPRPSCCRPKPCRKCSVSKCGDVLVKRCVSCGAGCPTRCSHRRLSRKSPTPCGHIARTSVRSGSDDVRDAGVADDRSVG